LLIDDFAVAVIAVCDDINQLEGPETLFDFFDDGSRVTTATAFVCRHRISFGIKPIGDSFIYRNMPNIYVM